MYVSSHIYLSLAAMTLNGAKYCNAYQAIITLSLEACRFNSNETATDSKAGRMETCETAMSLCYSLIDHVKPNEIYVRHFSLSDVSST
jgi:hypothetical protein